MVSSDFMTARKTWRALNNGWKSGREVRRLDRRTAEKLRQEYPNHVPLRIAAPLLGVSERQLARLVAEGREPFAGIGANIGSRQRYIRVYTERLIAYLSGDLSSE